MAIITGNFVLYVDHQGQPHDGLITEIKPDGLLNLVWLETANGQFIGYRQETSVLQKEHGQAPGWVELKYYGQEIK